MQQGANEVFLKQVRSARWRIADGIDGMARSWVWCCASMWVSGKLKAVKRHDADASPTEWEEGVGVNGLHNSNLE